jgi:hypothetical protein
LAPYQRAIASHADTTIGAVFFNLSPLGRASDEVRAFVPKRPVSPESRKEYARRLQWYLETYHYSLLVHEYFHIIQALVYPALYLRCLRELHLAFQVLSWYRHDQEPRRPIRMWLPPDWKQTFFAPTTTYRLSGSRGGGISLDLGDPRDRRSNDLTESDLIEEDASIFQYKVEIGAEGTGEGYYRWLHEKYRYTMAFKFLSRLLGRENAYIALPPLVRTAFRTTWPMTTFASLLDLTLRQPVDLPQRLGIDEYFDFLVGSTEESPSLGRQLPDHDSPATEDAYAYLDATLHGTLVQASDRHPLYPLARDLWVDRPDPPSLDWIFHPYRAFDRWRRTVVDATVEGCMPPITVIRLLDPALSVNDALAIVHPRFHGKPCPFLPDVEYDLYLRDAMDRKYLAFSLVTSAFDSYDHNCWHDQCPIFPTGLCRRWWPVPDDFRTCGFPTKFQALTYHKIDLAAGALLPEQPNGGRP